MEADDSDILVESCPVCCEYGKVFTLDLGPSLCPLCQGQGVVPHDC